MRPTFRRRRAVAAYPYHLYLGETHVVEVKKGGLHVGIYLITPTSRRRGVVLPLDAWITLQNSVSIVNEAINRIIQQTYHGMPEPNISNDQKGADCGPDNKYIYATNQTTETPYLHNIPRDVENDGPCQYEAVSNRSYQQPFVSTTVVENEEQQQYEAFINKPYQQPVITPRDVENDGPYSYAGVINTTYQQPTTSHTSVATSTTTSDADTYNLQTSAKNNTDFFDIPDIFDIPRLAQEDVEQFFSFFSSVVAEEGTPKSCET